MTEQGATNAFAPVLLMTTIMTVPRREGTQVTEPCGASCVASPVSADRVVCELRDQAVDVLPQLLPDGFRHMGPQELLHSSPRAVIRATRDRGGLLTGIRLPS